MFDCAETTSPAPSFARTLNLCLIVPRPPPPAPSFARRGKKECAACATPSFHEPGPRAPRPRHKMRHRAASHPTAVRHQILHDLGAAAAAPAVLAFSVPGIVAAGAAGNRSFGIGLTSILAVFRSAVTTVF